LKRHLENAVRLKAGRHFQWCCGFGAPLLRDQSALSHEYAAQEKYPPLWAGKVFLGDICLAAALHGTPWTSRVHNALNATSCRRGQARPYMGGRWIPEVRRRRF